MNTSLEKSNEVKFFKAHEISTPLGPMIAIGDEKALYLLEFMNRYGLEEAIKRLQKQTQTSIASGKTPPIDLIEKELCQYFKGTLNHFLTPIKMRGSPFQKRVWLELKKIPLGQTCAYADIAKALGNSRAVRAVGGANGANHLAIIIPCHRVINADGKIGGYGGGVARKRWLLEHESNHRKKGGR